MVPKSFPRRMLSHLLSTCYSVIIFLFIGDILNTGLILGKSKAFTQICQFTLLNTKSIFLLLVDAKGVAAIAVKAVNKAHIQVFLYDYRKLHHNQQKNLFFCETTAFIYALKDMNLLLWSQNSLCRSAELFCSTKNVQNEQK